MDLWKAFRLHFRIDAEPPDARAVGRVRARAAPDRLQPILAAGTGAALLAALAPLALSRSAWGWALTEGLLLAALVALPVFYWVRIAELLATATQPLGPAEGRAFAAWAERDETVGRYWARLVALRRPVVYGDYAALVAHATAVAGRAPRSNSELHHLLPGLAAPARRACASTLNARGDSGTCSVP